MCFYTNNICYIGELQELIHAPNIPQIIENVAKQQQQKAASKAVDPTLGITTTVRSEVASSLDALKAAGTIFFDEQASAKLTSPIWKFVKKLFWKNSRGKSKSCWISRGQCVICENWVGINPPENAKGHFRTWHQPDIQELENDVLKKEYCKWLNVPESWAFPELDPLNDNKYPYNRLVKIPDICIKTTPILFGALKPHHQQLYHQQLTKTMVSLGCGDSQSKDLQLQKLIEVKL